MPFSENEILQHFIHMHAKIDRREQNTIVNYNIQTYTNYSYTAIISHGLSRYTKYNTQTYCLIMHLPGFLSPREFPLVYEPLILTVPPMTCYIYRFYTIY